MSDLINPKYTVPHFSTRLWRAYKLYLNHHYGKDLFKNICEEMKIPEAYLSREDNWVSDEFARKFREILIRETGDKEIARKVGQFSISPDVINNLEYSIIKSLPPFLFFKLVKTNAPKLNRLYDIDIRKQGSGRFELTMTTRANVEADANVFLNTLGWIEATQGLFQLEKFQVHHTVEKFEDGRQCARFAISYSEKAWWLNKIESLSAVFGFFGLTYVVLDKNIAWVSQFTHLLPMMLTVLIACIVVLARGAIHFRKITHYLKFYHKQEKEKAQELYNSSLVIQRKYQEAMLLEELSSKLIGCRDPQEVINTSLKSMKDNFSFDKVAVFLLSKERGSLYFSSGTGFENVQIDTSKIEFVYPNPNKNDVFVANVLESGKSVLIDKIDGYKKQLKPVNAKLLEILEVGSMIVSPIQANEQKFGVVLVARTQNEKMLANDDKILVDHICTQLSLYFESATGFENEKKLKHIFKKYVPKQVLDQISASLYSTDGSLKPQKKEICSIFMDLRGFTKACDNLSPEKAFDLINLFANFVTKILSEEGAIIDNIIGDEVVAFFVKREDAPQAHINAALRACLRIKSEYADLNQVMKQSGVPSLRLGVGLHVGDASIGSVGGDAKMNFTAIGTTVNVASRLQSLSKNYSEESVCIIVSQKVLTHFESFKYIPFESELLRGTSEKTEYLRFNDTHADMALKEVQIHKDSRVA
jgi:class 3 adenylate cyclase